MTYTLEEAEHGTHFIHSDEHRQLDHWELGRRYADHVEHLAKIGELLDAHRARDRHLMQSTEWNWGAARWGLNFKTARPTTAMVVAPELGFNVFSFRSFAIEVPPGGTEGAYHVHGEAVKIYLRGRAREIVGDKTYEVGAGDVVLIPAHVWHGTENPYDEPSLVLAVAHAGADAPIVQRPIMQARKDLRVASSAAAQDGPVLADDYADLSALELARTRADLHQSISDLEVEMERRRAENRHLMRQSELEWHVLSEPNGADGPERRPRVAKAICPELGFPARNFGVTFVEVPPGGTDGALQMRGETLKYYLRGRGKETVGGKEYEVGPGDTVFVPGNTWHGTANIGSEPLLYFALSQARGMPIPQPVFTK